MAGEPQHSNRVAAWSPGIPAREEPAVSTQPTEAPVATDPVAPAATPEQPAPPAAAPAAPEPTTDWKSEARKWEARAKDNSTAAARLKEIEDASKTAEQKSTEDRAAAEKRAAEAELRLHKYEVTTAKFSAAGAQLTPDVLDLVTGSTREEIEASTDKVLRLIAASAAPTPPAGVHVAGEGSAPAGMPSLEDQIAAAQKSGDIALALHLQNQKLAPFK